MTGRDDAVYLSLRMKPESAECEAFVNVVARETWNALGVKTKKLTQSHREACGALLADLIRVYADKPGRYAYRSMSRHSFTGHRIGYRSFKQVVDASIKLGFIEKKPGSGEAEGEATRLRATSALIDLAKAHGVELPNWRKHVRSMPRPTSIPNPLVLRKSSRFKSGQKQPGVAMWFNPDEPTAKALANKINDLNTFFAGVKIEPHDCHYAFQRVFNQGEIPGSRWERGGRLISVGDSYQHMIGDEDKKRKEARERRKRSEIVLNDEAVVEIDIRSSHLRILYAKLGKEIDPAIADLYYHPVIPRNVIKKWVTMTLGYDRFQTRWSSEVCDDYLEEEGRTLRDDYPIKSVREAVLSMHPLLKDWESCPVRWGELHYTESCVIVDAVHELAIKHGVPALPVHDSIIVPVSQEALGKSVLTACFKRHVGFEPVLTTK